MRRWVTTFAAVMFCSAALRADVTIVQTTTIEGGMAAMAQQSGANMSPKMTTRIRGTKSRTDVDAGMVSVSTIVDLDAKQLTILNATQKTATVTNLAAPPPGTPAAPTTTGPTVDASIKPTGKSQVIDGLKCDEFTFATSVDMSTMAPANAPPEAAAAMQGLKMVMNGSMWVAKEVPGAEEYIAFQKSSAAANMGTAAMGASGMSVPGMDKLMKAMGTLNGLTYLTDMTMTIDGTGQIADMMRQMGPMKITVKVNSVKTDKVADDTFTVPAGYTTIKQ